MIRQKLFAAFVTLGLMSFGWHANNAYRWTVETLRKAAVCDRIQCDNLNDAASVIDTLKLPTVKK